MFTKDSHVSHFCVSRHEYIFVRRRTVGRFCLDREAHLEGHAAPDVVLSDDAEEVRVAGHQARRCVVEDVRSATQRTRIKTSNSATYTHRKALSQSMLPSCMVVHVYFSGVKAFPSDIGIHGVVGEPSPSRSTSGSFLVKPNVPRNCQKASCVCVCVCVREDSRPKIDNLQKKLARSAFVRNCHSVPRANQFVSGTEQLSLGVALCCTHLTRSTRVQPATPPTSRRSMM